MSWDKMCRLCGRQEIATNCNNGNCDTDIIENGHCRDKKGNAIPPVLDCEDHYRMCSLDCHEECACQDRPW